ncbi:condensation domain-containing protein [Dactylosporangium sp. NPDC000244]|uniref:condensation domain-containing protein n=1 Tax=Dactylosporangium sp. NPDC000244 TaxID=3154365 RepID=UPI0033347865
MTTAVPLAPAQERLWLLEEAAGGDGSCLTRRAFRVADPVDATALQVALRAVAEGHDVLRSWATRGPDGPQMRFGPADAVRLELLDVRTAPAPRQAALDAAADGARQAHDLSAGPLLRALLCASAPRSRSSTTRYITWGSTASPGSSSNASWPPPTPPPSQVRCTCCGSRMRSAAAGCTALCRIVIAAGTSGRLSARRPAQLSASHLGAIGREASGIWQDAGGEP